MSDPAGHAHGEPQHVDITSAPSDGMPTSLNNASGVREMSPTDSRDEVYFVPPMRGETIDEVYLETRLRRRWLLPLALFLVTCSTTFFAGVYQWPPEVFPFGGQTAAWVARNWWDGLRYMLALIGILFAHEMGHFLMTVRYRIHASYPIFIPLPLFTGTMGAVIAMDGRRADRRQMFDIGIAGPLAGLVVAIPVLCLGVKYGTFNLPAPGSYMQGHPLLAELLIRWLRPDANVGAEIDPRNNPFYMAGWVGMLITGLNMMPISQLDGGHVIYALFRRRAHYIARAFLLTAIGYMIVSEDYTWTLMIIVVTFLGADHPPTANDRVPLGRARYLLGLASLAIPVLCFIPNPF